jgi:hypothetical protein
MLKAYYAGLATQGDPDALRDLGVPVGLDDYKQHCASGLTVGRLTLGPTGVELVRAVQATLSQANQG